VLAARPRRGGGVLAAALAKYEGADRELAMALESIDECTRLRPPA
jgi:hypothetical protein